MNLAQRRPLAAPCRPSAPLLALSLLALLGGACNDPTIQNAGAGGSGHGGVSGGGSGGGPIINISGPLSSGGTTGSSLVCNSTSTAGCKAQSPPGCGDGVNNQGGIEECDDGNALPGDGCNGACKVEKNWECPPAGKCKRLIVCGDRQIGPGEVCDDGNTSDNDGCDSTCTLQDPAYTCIPGSPCVRTSECGNKRIEPGEDCEDGNTKSGDGCSSECKLEGGWVCPNPGQLCKQAPRCGDRVVQPTIGEVCDDSNQQDGDGCSADCKAKGAGCVCSPGELCKCPLVKCGNGILEGSEKCDDGNTKSGDGCAGDCKAVEKGFQCRVVGKACTPKCGDGVKSGAEACDDGNAKSGDGCSATCKLELGWRCDDSGKCTSTACGDKNIEGAEGCDDGNTVPFDGCSMDCQREPDCKGDACTSQCGDGIVLNEQCDDGNAGNGDGCTKDCKPEPGWTCTQPDIGDKMLVPAVYRDFRYSEAQQKISGQRNDFQPGATGSYNAVIGMVEETLDGEGKPVFTGIANVFVLSKDTFKQWYRDVSGVNHATAAKMTLWSNGNGGYVNRYGENGEQWNTTEVAYYCGTKGDELQDADGKAIPCTNKYEDTSPTECTTKLAAGQEMLKCYLDGTTYKAIFVVSKADGSPLFFPVDDDDFTPATERDPAKIPPYYDATATWPFDVDDAGAKRLHNFSFTSEVRYWFKYEAGKTYTLDFTGDDDVWVFVNKKLAVDLGGVHTPVNGTLVLSSTGGTVTVTPTLGEACTTTNKVTTCKSTSKPVNLGMSDNGVYEIAVFQAERQTDSSSYKLTLSGFNAAPSDCRPTCGDGVLVGDEECDCGDGKVPVPETCAGPNDDPAYNGCSSECKWGPFCGDGQTTDGEECDNGTNNDDYGASNGCAAGCKLPPRCGDGKVQTDFDEECDEGAGNLSTSDPKVAYGGCMANCKRGGRCGDGIKNGGEDCDDGVNDGTYGTCTPECAAAPKCGDGVVQNEYAEECEPKMSNDPDCTIACRLPGGCGDGIKQDPEQCDDGASANLGEYGGCAPSCIFAPHCGDGIMNGPEQCDDGLLDGSYGGCTGQCKLAPHCGDGIVNGSEACDHGSDNGQDGLCTKECKTIIYSPP